MITDNITSGQFESTVVNPGNVTYDTATVLHVCPTVRTEDGTSPTDEQLGLALIAAFRSIGGTITVTRQHLDDMLRFNQARLLTVELNGETLCSIDLVP